jgi:multiple sugar transport system substrate-binding protein
MEEKMCPNKRNGLMFLLATLTVSSLIVVGCAAPAPSVPETVVVEKTVIVEKEVPVEVEKIVEVTPVPEVKEPVELRIAWWGSENRHTRTIAVIKLFEQKYPHIKITHEFAVWNDHWTRLATQAAGGNLPDIMQQDYARLEEWVNNGLLIPLDDYVDSGLLDFSNVAAATLDGGRIDGKLYGVNLGTNSLGWAVDLDAVEKAGVELPPADWTWADFEAFCLELYDKLGTRCMSAPLAHDHTWRSIYLSAGEWVFSEDGKALGYSDDQPMIDLLNMILRLQEAGAVETQEEYDAQGGQQRTVEQDPLVTGETTMMLLWSNQLVAMQTAAGPDRHFKMLLVPRLEGGQSANYVKPSMFWSITSQSEHPEEAALFIDFFTNSVAANEILLAERGVPISSVVKESLKPLLEPAAVESFNFMDMVENDSVPVPPPDVAGWADVRNNIYYPEFVDPVLYGLISPEEGAATYRELANQTLAASQ